MKKKGTKRLWSKMIVALDLESKSGIKKIVDTLYPKVKIFKIGLIGYTLCGPEIIFWIIKKGGDVFLDLKLYDIPHTMATAARGITRMGVWAFTVHIKAGKDALRELKEAVMDTAQKMKVKAPLVVGVTELTSERSSLKKVLKLAEIAKEVGLDAVVCSVHEAEEVKRKFGLQVFCPGIRNKKDFLCDDQRRVATVKDAVDAGADYFIVGRPIVAAADCIKAAEELLKAS